MYPEPSYVPYDFKTDGALYIEEHVGATNEWEHHNFYGNIDDLRVYKKVLTSGEVARVAQKN